MSALPTSTHSAPNVPIYAAAGGGAASTLQSPVAVIPGVIGDTVLIAQATGTGDSIIEAIGGPGGFGAVIVGGFGQNYQIVAETPPITGAENVLKIGVDGGGAPAFSYTPFTNVVTIGDGTAGGSVQTNNSLVVTDPAGTSANSLIIAPVSATNTGITQSCATGGTVGIGSSQAALVTLSVSDAGAGTGNVTVAGNGSGGSVRLQGASSTGLNVPNIRSNNPGPATFNIGASGAAPQLIFCTDPTGTADQAYVDITKGTANGVGLRLQGYGGGTAATVSTNLGTGGGGKLNLSSGYNDAQAKIEIADDSITFARPPSAAAPGWAPIKLYGPQATGPGTITVDCSALPSGWCVVYGVSGSGANPLSPGDRASMFNTIIYSGPGNAITAGGLGGVPAYCTCLPSSSNNTSLDVNFASATSASYAIYGMPLIGG